MQLPLLPYRDAFVLAKDTLSNDVVELDARSGVRHLKRANALCDRNYGQIAVLSILAASLLKNPDTRNSHIVLRLSALGCIEICKITD